MTRVTQTDQIMQLLRQQLQRLGKGKAAARGVRTGKAAADQQSPLARVTALTAPGTLTDEDLARTLIRALLTEEFGETLASEPKFDRVVSEVYRMLAEDAETARLLARGVGELRG